MDINLFNQKETLNFGNNAIFIALSNFVLNENELEILKKEEYQNHNNSVIFSKNIRILENPKLSRIKRFFDKSIEYYTKEIWGVGDEFSMIHSWITINKQNSFHPLHQHSNVILSLTYYIQAESGNLQLFISKSSINKGFNFDYKIIKKTNFNANVIDIPVHSQKTVIFPGYLDHKTTPNQSNKDRIMLGANYFVKGIIGSDEEVTTLKI